MKKFLIVVAIVATLFIVMALPAFAGTCQISRERSMAESNILIFVSAGSETRAINGTLVLQTDTGKILAPSNGVIEIPNDAKYVNGQVFVEGAQLSKDFDIRWTTKTLANKDNLEPTEFNTVYGWRFSLDPEDYASNKDGDCRALSIWIKANGARKGYVRAGFKFTLPFLGGPAYENTQILLKVGNCGQGTEAMIIRSENWEKVTANFQAQDQYNKDVAGKVNNLESRVANLEAWAQAASGQRSAQPIQPVRQTIKIGYTIKVLCTDGRPYMGSYTICLADKDGEVKISKSGQPAVCMTGADPGTIRVKIETPQGSSDWVEFNAQTGCQVILRVGGVK